MAYEIHIDRVSDDGTPLEPELSLDEWKAIVSETNESRLKSTDHSFTNPRTGEVITIGRRDGDTEMLINQEWLPIFLWRNGRVSFKGLPSFDNPDDPIRRIAFSLAAKLDARVVGDGGEFYDQK